MTYAEKEVLSNVDEEKRALIDKYFEWLIEKIHNNNYSKPWITTFIKEHKSEHNFWCQMDWDILNSIEKTINMLWKEYFEEKLIEMRYIIEESWDFNLMNSFRKMLNKVLKCDAIKRNNKFNLDVVRKTQDEVERKISEALSSYTPQIDANTWEKLLFSEYQKEKEKREGYIWDEETSVTIFLANFIMRWINLKEYKLTKYMIKIKRLYIILNSRIDKNIILSFLNAVKNNYSEDKKQVHLAIKAINK